MNRYKKANEGIHAPEEIKERAARPAAKRPYARWMGAVAAVLVLAIVGGIALWPGQGGGPTADGPGQPRAYSGGEDSLPVGGPANPPANGGNPVPPPGSTGRSRPYALATASYPEMCAYPLQEDFFGEDGMDDEAWDAYDDAWTAYRESLNALRSNTDYTGMMDGFLSASTAQFLAGAGEGNRIYSPLNVYMALSMLAEATGGDSRQQILDLLQADSIEALRSRAAALWRDNYRDDGVAASILANSLWLRDGMTYSQETLDRLAADYYASSFSGEMGSEAYNQALQDWLNEQTKGLLAQQAAGVKTNRDTVLALASTIYFKAAWDSSFWTQLTRPDTFHAPSGDVEVDFMHQSHETTYYWGPHFAAVQLRFQQGGAMWLILPDEGYGVDQLLQTGEAMEFLLADKSGCYDEETGEYVETWPGQDYLKVNLSMPKFDVSSDLDLIEGLKALGVTDVFDYNVSNFDPLGASTDEALFVSQAKHAARVKVDEDGCEAAAYTVIMVENTAAAPLSDEADFTLDRPFLFAITGDSGLPLFVGTVNQP